MPNIIITNSTVGGVGTQTVNPNGTATFEVTVTNTGNVPLQNIVVTNPLTPSCDFTIALLTPGASQMYTCTLDNVTADFSNVVNVTGNPIGGGIPVTDSNSSDVAITMPNIIITNSTVGGVGTRIPNW